MKRILAGIFLCINLSGFSQLAPVSDFYSQYALAGNPAYAGSSDALDIALFYRQSMVGIEGSPKSLAMAMHTPMFNEKVGLGLFILNDRTGITSENYFIGNYSYRMDLGYGKLSMGVGFGLISSGIAWNKLKASDPDDDLLADAYTSGVLPDFSAGLYYSSDKYFGGISLPLFLTHDYHAETGKYALSNRFVEYNYFLSAGYHISVIPDWRFTPSFLLKYQWGKTTQFDINLEVLYKNRISAGLIYRTKSIFGFMLMCRLNEQFSFAYSYNFTTATEGLYRNNSHEVMLRYLLKYQVEATGLHQF